MINLCRYVTIAQIMSHLTAPSSFTKPDVCKFCSNWHCDTCKHAKYLEPLRSDGEWTFKFIYPKLD